MIESRIEYCQANANGSTSSPESYNGTESVCDRILQLPSIPVVPTILGLAPMRFWAQIVFDKHVSDS
jgi:hypothetical protein